MTRSIDGAISKGLAALVRMQSPDGSFPLWTGTNAWRPCGALFSTAAVLIGVGSLLPAHAIASGLAYIRSERRPDGLWEFDKAIGLPPDSDVVACALAALAMHGERSDWVGGQYLLRDYWRPGRGPFRTWKVHPLSGPDRDDPVVNGNVLFALRLLESPPTTSELASVRELFSRSSRSRYYCYSATVAHSAARAGLELNTLPLLVPTPPSPAHLLGTVEWLCTARTAEPSLINAVLHAQHEDGGWPSCPWFTADRKPRPFWGSPAVTTALAIEALHRISRL